MLILGHVEIVKSRPTNTLRKCMIVAGKDREVKRRVCMKDWFSSTFCRDFMPSYQLI